jgi:hypothetical protein
MPEPINQLLNPVTPLPVAPAPAKRFSFTGRLKTGKDFCAEAIGAAIFGLADPLYALLKQFFGTGDKNAPGARQFLQTVGQWGRGQLDEKHPLTPERASFIATIIALNGRKALPPNLGVKWQDFGINVDLWLNALLTRIETAKLPPGVPMAVTNCRFENEKKALLEAGFASYHTMCSLATWTARLKVVGLSPESPEVTNISETQAIKMDTAVAAILKAQPKGPRLRVIWTDEAVPCPSSRLLTVTQFVELAKK